MFIREIVREPGKTTGNFMIVGTPAEADFMTDLINSEVMGYQFTGNDYTEDGMLLNFDLSLNYEDDDPDIDWGIRELVAYVHECMEDYKEAA